MKLTTLSITLLGASLLFITSCGDDDSDLSNEVVAPETYAFSRDGSSTVSFSGQTTRILMAEEIISGLKDPAFTEETLDAMFDHAEGDTDFSDAELNASSKNVRSKTAASSDYFSANTVDATAIKEDFDSWISAQVSEVYPNWDNEASAGVAGQIQEAGGGSVRYVNAGGLEYNQAFNKALIGALMVDQALNNYLSTSVLDASSNVDDNDADIVAEGSTYTNMEHKWDEAYGYVYGTAANTADPVPTVGSDDSFLNKYIGRVEGDDDYAGISQTIFDAFKLGRAAIVAKNYTVRDEQAEIIREQISKVVAVRAIYYLQQGKVGLEAATPDYASVFHDLSEGFGFVYSLQFTRMPNSSSSYFTKTEVENYITSLTSGNGFWEASTATLDQISSDIAQRFNLDVSEAGS